MLLPDYLLVARHVYIFVLLGLLRGKPYLPVMPLVQMTGLREPAV